MRRSLALSHLVRSCSGFHPKQRFGGGLGESGQVRPEAPWDGALRFEECRLPGAPRTDAFANIVFAGLRGITVNGTPINGQLQVGQRRLLLGIFSVDLKRALDGSEDAHTNATSKPIIEALELFVFGRALEQAAIATVEWKP